MPILIVNHSEELQGLILRDRVLIGRRPFNTVMIPDPAVSRLHAWIGRREGRWTLFDAGSRIGTVVNTQVLEEPHILADGDEIRVGQTMLTYLEAEELPGDVAALEAAPPPPANDPYDGGIYFDCACGGPMWVAGTMAGATGRCRYCGERLVVPHLSGSKARPVVPAAVEGRAEGGAPGRKRLPPGLGGGGSAVAEARMGGGWAAKPQAAEERGAATAALTSSPGVAPTFIPSAPAMPSAPPPEPQVGTCSICQTAIRADEEQTACPSCHLTFHRQCWEENYGCSAYGCDQVNVLAPQAESAAATTDAQAPAGPSLSYDSDAPRSKFPWESVILALSFVATAVGAVTYGLPPILVQIWAMGYLLVRKPRRKGMVIAALFVGLIGTLAGCVISLYMWNNVRLWERLVK